MNDFAAMQRCATYGSSEVTDPTACIRFDRDASNQVDLDDFREFTNCATGAGIRFDRDTPPLDCTLW